MGYWSLNAQPCQPWTRGGGGGIKKCEGENKGTIWHEKNLITHTLQDPGGKKKKRIRK